MVKKLLRICLFAFCFLISGISFAHALTSPFNVHKAISQSLNFGKSDANHFASFGNVLCEPSSITNDFEAIEEVLEEDEDSEYSSYKKQVYPNNQYYINRKLFVGTGDFSSYLSNPSTQLLVTWDTTTSVSKQVLFCIFRI